MNIKVIKDNTMPSYLTGGEFGVSSLEVYVDPSLPERTQRALVTHAVIENYFPSLSHGKVEELCGDIEEALDELGAVD